MRFLSLFIVAGLFLSVQTAFSQSSNGAYIQTASTGDSPGNNSLPNIQESILIKDPLHAETNNPISFKSNDDKVCQYFGFKTAVKGSKKKARSWKFNPSFHGGEIGYVADYAEAMLFDQDGSIKAQEYYSEMIGRIRCNQDFKI